MYALSTLCLVRCSKFIQIPDDSKPWTCYSLDNYKKKSNGILIICNQRLLLSALSILKACMNVYAYITRRNTKNNYVLLTFGIKMSASSISGSEQDDCLPVSYLQRQLH